MIRLSKLSEDPKYDNVTEMLEIMLASLSKVPGYRSALISVRIDDAIAQYGQTTDDDVMRMLDGILTQLEPHKAALYIMFRAKIVIDLIKEDK